MNANNENPIATGNVSALVRRYRQFDAWTKQHRKQIWLFSAGEVGYGMFLNYFLTPVIEHHPALHTPWSVYTLIATTVLFLVLWALICFRWKRSA